MRDGSRLHELHLEVTCHEGGEIIACHLIEEHIFIQVACRVGEYEDIRHVGGGNEGIGGHRGAVAVGKEGLAGPDIAGVPSVAGQQPSLLHSLDDSAGHLGNLVLGIFLCHQFHLYEEAVALSGVELAHSVDEEELAAMWPFLEVLAALAEALVNDPVVARLVGIVGHRIEGVLKMLAVEREFEEARIGNGLCQFAVGEVVAQQAEVTFRIRWIVAPHGQQEEVVVHIVHILEVGEVIDNAVQGLLGQREVLYLLHLEDATVVESVEDHGVGFFHLFRREWNLLEVVFALVRVVLERVFQFLFLLAESAFL